MLNDLVFKNMETCTYQIFRKNKFTLKNIFSRYKLIKKYVTKFTSTNFFHFLTIIKKIISKYKRTNLTFSQNDYNKIIHIKHKWVQRIHIINFSLKNLMYVLTCNRSYDFRKVLYFKKYFCPILLTFSFMQQTMNNILI